MRKWCKNLSVGGVLLLLPVGCGHRQGAVAAAPVAKIATTGLVEQPAARPPQTLMVLATAPATAPATSPAVRTFKKSGIQFDYPGDWVPDKAATACLAIRAPKSTGSGYSSLSLDIPKLPWHLPGMISVNMVANGYISDLKKNQIHDAVVKENHPVTVAGCPGREITSKGHENGKPSIDVAVVLVHADQVYILSADSDEAGYDAAKKTLDAVVASLKWVR